MNTPETEVEDVLRRLRRFGGEPAKLEVKKATGGLPKNLVETVSAFANTNGGLIILGVDESEGFIAVPLTDPAKLRDDLVSAASDQLTPPVRPDAELVEADGEVIVMAKIDPLPSEQRPCYAM
ncbi:MAG: AlbA family DNA-binding domain-containing protein [Pseudonocardiaceae bacterium]